MFPPFSAGVLFKLDLFGPKWCGRMLRGKSENKIINMLPTLYSAFKNIFAEQRPHKHEQIALVKDVQSQGHYHWT